MHVLKQYFCVALYLLVTRKSIWIIDRENSSWQSTQGNVTGLHRYMTWIYLVVWQGGKAPGGWIRVIHQISARGSWNKVNVWSRLTLCSHWWLQHRPTVRSPTWCTHVCVYISIQKRTCTESWCINFCTIILSDFLTARIFSSIQSSLLDLLFQFLNKYTLNINFPSFIHINKHRLTSLWPVCFY